MAETSERIRIEPHPGRVTVTFGGRIVADTRKALVLREAGLGPVLYLPREDAAMEHLEPTRHRTRCPYKGEASYFTLKVGDEIAENAVWCYEQPLPAAAAIAGHLAFYRDKVEIAEQAG
jgi:uncharacterized protein (DUF427 family)